MTEQIDRDESIAKQTEKEEVLAKAVIDETQTGDDTGNGDAGDAGGDVGGDSGDTGAGGPTAKTGLITADEKKRYLAVIAANNGLEKAAVKIAKKIDKRNDGGILIVDELLFAGNDLIYLDIKKRTEVLKNLCSQANQKCDAFLDTGKTPFNFEDVIESLANKTYEKRMMNFLMSGGGLAAGLGVVQETLGMIGSIVEYFRSDYTITGQDLENLDDFYAQALVADKLIGFENEVYLNHFHTVQQTQMLDDVYELMEQTNRLSGKTAKVKSQYVEPIEAKLQALQEDLNSLRPKWIEYLGRDDEEILALIRTEIKLVEQELQKQRKKHLPDVELTDLEANLKSIREKILAEISKVNDQAKNNLEAEINKIIKTLEDNAAASPDKKLSDIKLKALDDLLKQLQAELVKTISVIGNEVLTNLRMEMTNIQDRIVQIQQTRVSDKQIQDLEKHLDGLNGKLLEALMDNDHQVKTGLEDVIQKTIKLMNDQQSDLGQAKGIVSSSTQLKQIIDDFITAITTVAEGQTMSPLWKACLREVINQDRIKYLLKVKLVSGGADFITETPNLINRRPATAYLGGGVISFILADKTGRIYASGTVSDLSAIQYKLGKNPRSLNWQFDE